LLEDDSLITKVEVSTDRLLSPLESEEHIHDVHLVIGVTIRVVAVTGLMGNIEFLGG